MPAIRDQSFSFESVTTDGGVTIPICSYDLNDLLFAFSVGDTGAPTWGCSNGIGTWNQLFTRNNTCSLACYWKYAAASGEGDVVFTATVNETYCGAVVAVRDVYQSYTGGSPPVQSNAAQAAASRFALPTITTSAADSLVLVGGSSSAVASLFYVEDALQDLVKVDGSAEALALGWFFKKAAGLTTAYNAGCLATGAGSNFAIEVRAPAGGATVRPAYPVSDASIFLMGSPGAVFDGSTALAATADTNFGTSIASKTCNDATVAAAIADVGIDRGAFMSFGGVTNATTANQQSGAETVVPASRYNIGTRNVLGHFRHPTPLQNQRLTSIASGRGVWFGMKSGATAAQNWKVWQVHGGDAALVPGYVQPIVINEGNTDTIATNGTLSNSDVRRYGYWTGGIGALTNQSCFGPMWAMDTLILAGGVSAEPIGIPEIVQAAALNKNRFSSVLQGANQMLCLQAIQFGDGATNPVYLLLESTAIEFPSKKNSAKKIVNYNGVDDSVGFTYYGGAGDTIIHRSSVVSSASKFHWRIHASASSSATWDFSGLALIGAGDVQLRQVTTFTGMSFTDCLTITQNGAAVSACSFDNSKVFSGNPANISDCAFASGGTGHAIEITAAGTYSFDGNTFSGYGADGTTDAAVYNNSGGAVTLNITGGGGTPTVRNGAGASTTVNANVSVTLTGLKNPTEIRVFSAGTQTEVSGTGAENVTTGSHVFSVGSGVSIDISVLSLGYQNLRILAYSTTSDATIPVSQVLDRQYLNP